MGQTGLNDGIYNSELFCDRYNVFRRDRNLNTAHKNDGGGVILAIANDFIATKNKKWETE